MTLRALTRRAPIWGGRADCVVVTGGRPLILPGRTATLEARELTDRIFAETAPVAFIDQADVRFVGRDSDAFVDRLIDAARDGNQLAREWLRELMTRGFGEMAKAIRGEVPQ